MVNLTSCWVVCLVLGWQLYWQGGWASAHELGLWMQTELASEGHFYLISQVDTSRIIDHLQSAGHA